MPGLEGEPGTGGAAGTNGTNAFTLLTTIPLTLPAVGGAVIPATTVADNSAFGVGQTVFISDGVDFGTFRIVSKGGTTVLNLTFLGAPGDGTPGASIGVGGSVSPGGSPQSTPLTVATGGTGDATLTDRSVLIGRGTAAVEFAVPGAAGGVLRSTGAATNPAFGQVDLADTDAVTGLLPIANVALGATIPTVLTDNSTGTASNIIAAGAGQFTHSVYFRAAAITGNVLVYTYTPGYAYKILRISASIVDAITTAARAATLTTAIAGTPTTGGVVTLAGVYALGDQQASSAAITALNTGSTVQAITVTASAVTAFAEGGFMLHMQIQNMDTANAVASLADHVNDVIDCLA